MTMAVAKMTEFRLLDDAEVKEVNEFYRQEINFLQSLDYDNWVANFDPAVRYHVVTCLSTMPGYEPGSTPGEVNYYDEDMPSLRLRFRKMRSEMAWTESPPARRRYFYQLLDYGTDGEVIDVSTNVLVLLSRGDEQDNNFAGVRRDRFVRRNGSLALLHRRVELDRTIVVDRFLNTFF